MRKRTSQPVGRPYPEGVKEEALRLLRRSPLPVEEIGRRLGVKVETLRGWACERSISLRWRSARSAGRTGQFKTLANRDKALCEMMLSNCATLAELANRFGLTREGVRQVALQHGVYNLCTPRAGRGKR